jgi:hypothetical protein
MADFPTALTGATDAVTDVLAKHINNLETKVGINSSADATSIDYLLKSTSSSNPGHKHTLSTGATDLTKATAAELDTGTDDAKYATALAIAGRSEQLGWTPIRGTFSYDSATTINISAGGASVYTIGDKIRFQNNDSGTYLYAYVLIVTDSLLTVVGDAVPNATLTDVYYSKVANPQGFPHWFNATIVWTTGTFDDGAGGQPTNVNAKFCIVGRNVKGFLLATGLKAGTGDYIRITSGLPAPASSSNYNIIGTAYLRTPTNVFKMIAMVSSPSNIDFNLMGSVSDNVVIDGLAANFSYDI